MLMALMTWGCSNPLRSSFCLFSYLFSSAFFFIWCTYYDALPVHCVISIWLQIAKLHCFSIPICSTVFLDFLLKIVHFKTTNIINTSLLISETVSVIRRYALELDWKSKGSCCVCIFCISLVCCHRSCPPECFMLSHIVHHASRVDCNHEKCVFHGHTKL